MKQEIAAVPASRFGLHLSDEAHPAARGYVRDDLTREGALRVPELPRGWHFAPEAYDGIAGWWNWGGAEPLLITGPAGSGKTASVLAFCAVMQMPAVVFTARPRMDPPPPTLWGPPLMMMPFTFGKAFSSAAVMSCG